MVVNRRDSENKRASWLKADFHKSNKKKWQMPQFGF